MSNENNENNGFDIKDGVLEKYHGSETSVVIPEDVTIIGCEAFKDCASLTSVTIPGGVKK